MNIAELLLIDYDAEILNTRRILKLIPDKNPEWKPDEKSMPIGRLALHTARMPEFCTRMLTTHHMDMATEKFPAFVFESAEHLVAELDRSAAEAKVHLETSTDINLHSNWKLTLGEQVFVDAPRMLLYRTMFLNHMIHHRAQLGLYLRLLGVPIPGLYGPSADEPVIFR